MSPLTHKPNDAAPVMPHKSSVHHKQLAVLAGVLATVALAAGCGSTRFGATAVATASRSQVTPAGDATSGGTGSGTSASTTGSGTAAGTPTGTGSGTVAGVGSGAGSGTGSIATANVLGTTQPPPPNIGFGLLVNDLNCTFCHLEVHGTVVSVATVPAFRSDSHGEVFGKWLINGAYNAPAGLANPPLDGGIVISTGNATSSYNNAGGELPVDPTTKAITFPNLDFTGLAATVQGSLASSVSPSSPLVISKAYTGNVVMVGTQGQPIILNKDVLINGDLVIKGYYTGVGTIYVTGNIYIPANLRALNLASFPYSDTPATADAAAKIDLAAGNKDALGLATAKNIFVGDLENYMDSSNGDTGTKGADGERYVGLYDAAVQTDPLMLNTKNGIRDVYNWLPEAQFDKLYETGIPCWTSSNRTLVTGHAWGEREFSEIDAYLYAAKAISGTDRATNWTINGGMIAQAMHIVSGAGSDSVAATTPCNASRINFDYRMRNGLQVLEGLSGFFPAIASGSGSGS